MGTSGPDPISKADESARRRRVLRIAREQGFIGRVEYRHVYGHTGGGQYCHAPMSGQDVLLVFAEAFERDADPEDFSLESILAHERGHQLLLRHERITRTVPLDWSDASEEIVASLIGSIIVRAEADQHDLLMKAGFDAVSAGFDAEKVVEFLTELRALLEELL